MNEKHAREARILNRLAGTLVKRPQVTPGKRHKLPRAVKAMWESKSHRERGELSRHWRATIASRMAPKATP